VSVIVKSVYILQIRNQQLCAVIDTDSKTIRQYLATAITIPPNPYCLLILCTVQLWCFNFLTNPRTKCTVCNKCKQKCIASITFCFTSSGLSPSNTNNAWYFEVKGQLSTELEVTFWSALCQDRQATHCIFIVSCVRGCPNNMEFSNLARPLTHSLARTHAHTHKLCGGLCLCAKINKPLSKNMTVSGHDYNETFWKGVK
jgi:hypothetical protein